MKETDIHKTIKDLADKLDIDPNILRTKDWIDKMKTLAEEARLKQIQGVRI